MNPPYPNQIQGRQIFQPEVPLQYMHYLQPFGFLQPLIYIPVQTMFQPLQQQNQSQIQSNQKHIIKQDYIESSITDDKQRESIKIESTRSFQPKLTSNSGLEEQIQEDLESEESDVDNQNCSEYLPDTNNKDWKHKKGKGMLWTRKEVTDLIKYYKQHKGKWKDVMQHLPGRNESQCSQKYRKVMKNNHQNLRQKNRWTPQEDQILLGAYKKFGNNWVKIAGDLPGRNCKQARERFINNLDPRISTELWSNQEDKKLMELFDLHGKKWAEISKGFPNRSSIQLRNRYQYLSRQNLNSKQSGDTLNLHMLEQDEMEKIQS